MLLYTRINSRGWWWRAFTSCTASTMPRVIKQNDFSLTRCSIWCHPSTPIGWPRDVRYQWATAAVTTDSTVFISHAAAAAKWINNKNNNVLCVTSHGQLGHYSSFISPTHSHQHIIWTCVPSFTSRQLPMHFPLMLVVLTIQITQNYFWHVMLQN